MEQELFQILAISLGLGLLVGLQRQHDNAQIAGIRTFPIITLFGTLTALMAREMGGWVVAAGLLATASLVVTANLMKKKEPSPDVGQTTEAALLLMFAVGAYLVFGSKTVAVALGATVAVLLHLKETLHHMVARIGQQDLTAIMQFVVISFVILPILPNEAFGPYEVLNPYNIWLMVVLIVGIGLLGYFVYKIFGNKAGTFLGGVLGGLISSTATTVSYARRAKESKGSSQLAAIVIFIASTVAFFRILTEILIVAPGVMPQVAPPLLVVVGLMVVTGLIAYFTNKEEGNHMPEQENPAQLKAALVFGAIYGLVILATAAAEDYLGDSGLYIVAIISGLTDVDAITLSTSRLMSMGNLSPDSGWRIILVAALSNVAFKGALAGFLGNSKLFAKISLLFGIVLLGGLLVLWWWPADFKLFS
ncbi:MgtC/SapB family protein [Pontibacter sp. BT731]|uniref:MgtC/SapB family protein n=1 Tax=Pontibacter coccineus TaxID=3063328 RepID=UPI0026E1A940|nr:MgtC/SapB family protein [Pontibacter sp. BT731]MDO6390146.1 MgtC/SapB family protein [Pontibacter sp. BT731]